MFTLVLPLTCSSLNLFFFDVAICWAVVRWCGKAPIVFLGAKAHFWPPPHFYLLRTLGSWCALWRFFVKLLVRTFLIDGLLVRTSWRPLSFSTGRRLVKCVFWWIDAHSLASFLSLWRSRSVVCWRLHYFLMNGGLRPACPLASTRFFDLLKVPNRRHDALSPPHVYLPSRRRICLPVDFGAKQFKFPASVPSILHVSFGRISLFSVGCQTFSPNRISVSRAQGGMFSFLCELWALRSRVDWLSPSFCRWPNRRAQFANLLDWWALVSPNLLIRIAKPTFQIAVFRALFAFSLSIAVFRALIHVFLGTHFKFYKLAHLVLSTFYTSNSQCNSFSF